MNTKKLSYLFVAIALILVLAAAVLTVAYNTNYAYADYQDILNDPNSIVNFNQQLNIKNVNSSYYGVQVTTVGNGFSFSGTSTAEGFVSLYTMSTVSGHVYYFYSTLPDTLYNSISLYHHNGSTYDFNFNAAPKIVTLNGNYATLDCNIHSGYTFNGTFYFNLIDLTQMFGSDSLPNLDECKELFVADYYNYNTGSALSIGTIESYNKGVEDTLNSFDLTLSQYLVGSTAFAFNNSTITDSTITYDSTVNSYVFKNVIGVPLMDTIESGTNFTVDFILWDLSTGESQSYYMSQYLNFGYVDSNNNLVNISKMSSSAYVGEAEVQYTGVFVLPVSTDTIYIWVSYQNDSFSDDSFIALDSNITFRSLNVASLIKESYASGLQANKDFYSVGGAGYNQIYQSGYNAGTMVVTPYTFSRLLTAVIEAPLGAVLEIFNFDFMGYNFKNFITVMFTLCLIIAIVRMFMGGKE